MESKVVKADFKKLDAFVKGLSSSSGWAVRVGIMGKKNQRNDKSGQSNADIGFVHEFGQPPHIPQRSFLRMPITVKSDRIIKETTRDIAVKKTSPGDIVAILTDLGINCERAVLDAFDSGGFGTWAKNAPSTIRRKGSSQPLIDLGFLRKSISSEVVKV